MMDYQKDLLIALICLVIFPTTLYILLSTGLCYTHEPGHLIISKYIYGCQNVSITCDYSKSYFSTDHGTCIDKIKEKCNVEGIKKSFGTLQSKLTNLGGFLFYLVIYLLSYYGIFSILRKRYNLNKKYLTIGIILIIIYSILSSRSDLNVLFNYYAGTCIDFLTRMDLDKYFILFSLILCLINLFIEYYKFYLKNQR